MFVIVALDAHIDCCRGPQTESEFESGKNSEDYMMKLLEHMWTLSTEYKTATAQDLTGGRSRRGAQRTVPPDGSTVDVSAATAASQRPTKHGVEVVPSVGVSDGGGGAGTGTHGGEPDGLKPTCDCGKECILRDAGGKVCSEFTLLVPIVRSVVLVTVAPEGRLYIYQKYVGLIRMVHKTCVESHSDNIPKFLFRKM